MPRNVLILCTGNSCRSQIAEGFFRKYCSQYKIYSAGIEAHGLNPLAVKVMQEVGIDISHQKSKQIDELAQVKWDVVITVCDHANERCPILAGKHQRLHRSFIDPAAMKGSEIDVLPVYRKVRDQIHDFTREFCKLDALNANGN